MSVAPVIVGGVIGTQCDAIDRSMVFGESFRKRRGLVNWVGESGFLRGGKFEIPKEGVSGSNCLEGKM